MTARERMFARQTSRLKQTDGMRRSAMPASFRRESRNSLLESHSPRRCPRPERLLDPERCAVMAIVEHEACMTEFENVAATESEVRGTVFCGDNCESQQVYAASADDEEEDDNSDDDTDTEDDDEGAESEDGEVDGEAEDDEDDDDLDEDIDGELEGDDHDEEGNDEAEEGAGTPDE